MLEVKQLPETGISIAEAAQRTGVSVHTLRYYERAGLVVTTVDRTASGRRRYHQLDLDWIQENLELIDHKIDVYRGRLEAGDADRLWAPRG